MASETKRDPFELSGEWQDVCETYPDIAGVDVTLQAQFSYRTSVVFGGETEPAANSASLELGAGQGVRGNADHIWVKGGGALTVHVEG